jgi:hypothetical protein
VTRHVAQVNVARAKAPIDSPALAGFVAMLEPVNARADTMPGFVWRLQDDSGDATSIRAFDDDLVIVNMSVWESIDALWAFVYDGMHLEIMRRRREWFQHFGVPPLTLWWVPAGHVPSVDEAKERLELLQANGPSPAAFTFKERYAASSLRMRISSSPSSS